VRSPVVVEAAGGGNAVNDEEGDYLKADVNNNPTTPAPIPEGEVVKDKPGQLEIQNVDVIVLRLRAEASV